MYLNLNPRKAKELLPEVSSETGLPLELLEDLTDFYWNDLHKTLTGLEHYHVKVPHFGTFHIKGDRHLVPEIEDMERQVSYGRKHPPETAYRYAIWDSRERKLARLKVLLEYYYQETKAKKQNRELRKQIRDAKETLGQPEANP